MSFFDPFNEIPAVPASSPVPSSDISSSLSIAIDPEEEDEAEPSQPGSFDPFGGSPPQSDSNSGSFDPFSASSPQADSNFGSFDFTFDNFTPSAPSDDSAFTFEVDSPPPTQSEEDILYAKFEGLMGHPCFEYTGRPLVELFKMEDDHDTIDSVYDFLVNPNPSQHRK
jgi:hypothetical protein